VPGADLSTATGHARRSSEAHHEHQVAFTLLPGWMKRYRARVRKNIGRALASAKPARSSGVGALIRSWCAHPELARSSGVGALITSSRPSPLACRKRRDEHYRPSQRRTSDVPQFRGENPATGPVDPSGAPNRQHRAKQSSPLALMLWWSPFFVHLLRTALLNTHLQSSSTRGPPPRVFRKQPFVLAPRVGHTSGCRISAPTGQAPEPRCHQLCAQRITSTPRVRAALTRCAPSELPFHSRRKLPRW
jgi:hypothetical protein